MAAGNILREMFVKISMRGGPQSKKELGALQRGLKRAVGDIKVFQANLAALAVSKVFSSLAHGISSAVTGLKELIVESSNLAGEQEQNENRLRSAMEVAGDFSESEFQGLKNWASEMQNATEHGDELLLSQLALAKGYGATNEQAMVVVEASIEMAAALGKALPEATQQVAKSLGGFAGELGELSPEIKALTAEQLANAGATTILLKSYGGRAAKQVKTFAGAFKQLSAAIGDAKEQIGFPINEVLVPAFKDMKESIVAMTPVFAKFGKNIGAAIQVAIRMFRDLGGQDFFTNILDDFGEFVIRMALLFEDFVRFLSGERSAIGEFLDKKGGIGSVVTQFLSDMIVDLISNLPSIFVTVADFIHRTIINILSGMIEGIVNTVIGGIARKFGGDFSIDIPTFPGVGALIRGDGSDSGSTTKTTTNNANKSTSVVQHIEVKASGMESFAKQLEMAYKTVEPFLGVS